MAAGGPRGEGGRVPLLRVEDRTGPARNDRPGTPGTGLPIAGYLDDNVAQGHPWGIRIADIRVPVVVRHGELDRLVNVGHGRWLAETIPGARGVFLADAGHGSVALPWADVVADLLRAAG